MQANFKKKILKERCRALFSSVVSFVSMIRGFMGFVRVCVASLSIPSFMKAASRGVIISDDEDRVNDESKKVILDIECVLSF